VAASPGHEAAVTVETSGCVQCIIQDLLLRGRREEAPDADIVTYLVIYSRLSLSVEALA
jgi:hypothetical protein